MSPITNHQYLSKKAQIKLVRDDFTSPILGNIWIGRVATLNRATAKRFVDLGYAVFVDEKEQAAPAPVKKEVEAPEPEDEKLSLTAALDELNHDDSAHWTKGGLPDLNVLKELTGSPVKRQDVEDIAPDLVRNESDS